jgi:hypothetical protein
VITRRTYGALSWAIIAFGLLHMSATWSRFDQLNSSALWFFSGGLPAVLVGGINLLNRAYGAIAPGLRWFCVAANVGLVGFSVVGGVVTHATASQMVIVVGLMATVAILSWTHPRPG